MFRTKDGVKLQNTTQVSIVRSNSDMWHISFWISDFCTFINLLQLLHFLLLSHNCYMMHAGTEGWEVAGKTLFLNVSLNKLAFESIDWIKLIILSHICQITFEVWAKQKRQEEAKYFSEMRLSSQCTCYVSRLQTYSWAPYSSHY